MAKKEVIWSLRAQQDRLEILEYWINRNKSTLYSEKLYKLFKEATKIISEHPEVGKPTDIKGIRLKIIRDYLMIYEIHDNRIDILLIWDSRRDPKKLGKTLKKKNR